MTGDGGDSVLRVTSGECVERALPSSPQEALRRELSADARPLVVEGCS